MMAAAIAIAVLGSLAFIAWMIFRAVKEKTLTAHVVSYGIAILAAVFTYGYFLSLDVDALIKIVVSIVVGVILIFMAASRQRRSRQA
jgi:amino acid permease